MMNTPVTGRQVLVAYGKCNFPMTLMLVGWLVGRLIDLIVS